MVCKLACDRGAHIVGLYELIQRLIPGGIVQVELLLSHWELGPVSWLIFAT